MLKAGAGIRNAFIENRQHGARAARVLRPWNSRYATLSHRWEQDELSYQDLQAQRNRDGAGFTKVQKSCKKASTDGYEWLWVDTCCIDKSSSAELSDAINSMFRWYQDAQVCYAYLSDVPTGCTTDSHHEGQSPFRRSQWFTRGWTLQELIAPSSVIFLDQAWTEIGTRHSLEHLISSITGIENLNEVDESVRGQTSNSSKVWFKYNY